MKRFFGILLETVMIAALACGCSAVTTVTIRPSASPSTLTQLPAAFAAASGIPYESELSRTPIPGQHGAPAETPRPGASPAAMPYQAGEHRNGSMIIQISIQSACVHRGQLQEADILATDQQGTPQPGATISMMAIYPDQSYQNAAYRQGVLTDSFGHARDDWVVEPDAPSGQAGFLVAGSDARVAGGAETTFVIAGSGVAC